MKRNNNTNRKENEMKSQLHLNEIVAIKMNSGLTNEKDQITEIGRVLKEMGKDFKERNWLLSYDEDFIPDVLACYKPVQDTEYGFFLAAR
jgi:hypothetical protein